MHTPKHSRTSPILLIPTLSGAVLIALGASAILAHVLNDQPLLLMQSGHTYWRIVPTPGPYALPVGVALTVAGIGLLIASWWWRPRRYAPLTRSCRRQHAR
ncbi:hypothetical protein [Lysobacter sp. CA196]|uniref:hypothetical protein n=1 Tax=Lysobacter sp. CA196 TaxID=3455606 RepID=UPI003F8D3A26